MESKIYKVRYSDHGDPGKPFRPKIQMEGKWLEELGFKIGTRIMVEYDKESIHIRPCTDQENAVEDEKILRAQIKECLKEADRLNSLIAKDSKAETEIPQNLAE